MRLHCFVLSVLEYLKEEVTSLFGDVLVVRTFGYWTEVGCNPPGCSCRLALVEEGWGWGMMEDGEHGPLSPVTIATMCVILYKHCKVS